MQPSYQRTGRPSRPSLRLEAFTPGLTPGVLSLKCDRSALPRILSASANGKQLA